MIDRRVCRRKLLICQNWSCFHSLNGWLWHWVHCTCTPMNKPRRLGGRLDGFVVVDHLGQQEIDRAVFVGAPLRGHQVVNDLVPRTVLGERLAEKSLHAGAIDEADLLAADVRFVQRVVQLRT